MAAIPHQIAAPHGTYHILDQFFDAVRNREPDRVREILKGHPELVNSFNERRPVTTQFNFGHERFEYISTQDILQYQVTHEIVDPEYCHQRPLHLACMIGDVQTVKALLEQKDIGLYDENGNGETSFSVACRAANFYTAELLLIRGFKPSSKMVDKFGNRPFDYLIYRGIYPEWPQEKPLEECYELFRKILFVYGSDVRSRTQLLSAVVTEGNLPIFEAVFDCFSSPDMNTTDDEGWPLLHLAARNGHTKIVERLLERGADPTVRIETQGLLDAGEIAMEFLNGSETAEEIYFRIKLAQSSGESRQSDFEGSKLDCWRWMSHDRCVKGSELGEVKQCKIAELIPKYGRKASPAHQGETLWCHLHVNSVSA